MFIFSRRTFLIGALSVPISIPALKILADSSASPKEVELAVSSNSISGNSIKERSSTLRIRSWESSAEFSAEDKYVTFPASWKTGWH